MSRLRRSPAKLQIHEFEQTLLVHPVTAVGPIPTICDPDGVYPYPSFIETSHRPVLRSFQFLSIENRWLRVTICPDLGGKVYSIYNLESQQEILFIPASIQPVRILPRFGFVPGGIEVSFPISHSPVQLEKVACKSGVLANRAYIWCGERELRFGMQWTIEYSLGPEDRFLTQRTQFRNLTAEGHPWMAWSNAALPARPDTQFHFPNGPVLQHGAEVQTIDWASAGPRTLGDLKRMTGFFWLEPAVNSFGAFTPSLGQGLYHLADRASVPGMKLWSYGSGSDARWGRCASSSGESYLEIQAGPIRDQSIKQILNPGQSRTHTEFWLPSAVPLDLGAIELPKPRLVPLGKVPWFDWPPRADVLYWSEVVNACAQRTRAALPPPPALDQNWWAPSGIEELGRALKWAIAVKRGLQRDAWQFQLGAWLAARGQTDPALEALAFSDDDRARALAARLLLHGRKDPRAAAEQFRAIRDPQFALHPQVMIERDRALAGVGSDTLQEREQWLERMANSPDEWLQERRAVLLLDQGKPREARAVLLATPFQLVHQRYVRTELWNRINQALNEQEPAPELGEDKLAPFGAYREFD